MSHSYTQLTFDKQLTLITGKNGHGKSVLVDAIFFSLYGRAFRNVSLAELVKIKEKNMETRVVLNSNNKTIEIHRGIKPNFLKIVINGNPLEELANQKDYQGLLEAYLPDPEVFRQIIAISSNDKSLMFSQLNAKKKMLLIERLTDSSIFADILTRSKETKKTLQDQYTLLHAQQEQIRISNKALIDKSERLQAQQDAFNKTVQEANDKIKEKNEKLKLQKEQARCTLSKESTTINIDKSALNQAQAKLKDTQDKLLKIRTLLGTYDNVQQVDCPNCRSKFKPGVDKEKLSKLTEAHKKFSSVLEIDKIELQKAQASYNENVQQKEEQRILESAKVQAQSIIDTPAFVEQSLLQEDYTFDLQEENSEQVQALNHKITLYKDFDKNLIALKELYIASKLSLLNKHVNVYLEKLEAGFNAIVRGNLSLEIHRNGHEQSLASLSNGQKQRLDFALLFSFIELNNLSNILFVDELLDASLDAQGQHNIIDILKSTGKNVFVISHAIDTSLEEQFDIKYKVDHGVLHELEKI